MKQKVRKSHNRDPSPPSLLIAAHCSTIQRKSKRLETEELAAILDDFVRELSSDSLRLETYLHYLNIIVTNLNSSFPPALLKLPSHYFFSLIRDRIRNLVEQLNKTNRLNDPELYALRNCTILLQDFIEAIDDVSQVLHWITNETFLEPLAICLNHTDKISTRDDNKNVIKQIGRLLSIFCNIQDRLPIDLHKDFFEKLLQPTINCLTSTNYVRLFRHLKPNAVRLTEIQKLFLIRCPHFITSYNGPHLGQTIEQIFEKMLPRYVTIFDKHMKTIQEWNRPMMRAVHNLIITIISAEDYFSSQIHNKSFRSLIHHLLRLLKQPTLVNKIKPNSNNLETLLIDATLIAFSILVYEPDALEYLRRRRSAATFRKLTTASCETISLNAYMLLAYTISDDDIKTSQDNLPKLLSTTIQLLRRLIKNHQETNENITRNILQLVETLKGLSQYEPIKTEISKQGMIGSLIDCYEKLDGLSKEVLLDCLWTLSFDENIAQQLREYPQFIISLRNIPQATGDDTNQQNAMRRSHSYSSHRSNSFIISNEGTVDGLKRIADGLLWNIVQESDFRKTIEEKKQQQIETYLSSRRAKYEYDIMLSYCYADEDIIYPIKQLLTAQGYNVWLDRNQNQRQAIETVAEVIENTEFIIICMSESYKRDNNCQAEAEYAIKSKRHLLPLVIRKDYKPDGWLRQIINDSIYIDFGSFHFQTASELLVKELKRRRKENKRAHNKPRGSKSQSSVTPKFSGSHATSNNSYTTGKNSKTKATNSSSSDSSSFAAVNKQQQLSSGANSRSTTPGSMFTTTASNIVNGEAPGHRLSRPSLSESVVKEQQQPPSTLIVGTSAISTSDDKEYQQPPVPIRLPSRTLPTNFISSPSSATTQKEQQRTTSTIFLTPLTSDVNTSIPTSTIDQQQQQQQTILRSTPRSSIIDLIPPSNSVLSNRQQTQDSINSQQQPVGLPSNVSSTMTTDVNQQQPQVISRSISRSPTPSSISSDASDDIEKKQEQLLMQSSPQVPSANIPSSIASVTVIHQTQQQSTYSVARSTPDNRRSSIVSNAVSQEQHQEIPAPRFSTTNTVFPTKPAVIVQQQIPTYPVSQLLTNNIVSSSSPNIVISKQNQNIQLPPRPRLSTADSKFSDTSTILDEQQTTKNFISQLSINNTTPSISSIAANKQLQETPILVTLQSPTNTDKSSNTPPISNKQEQQLQAHSIQKLPVSTPVRSTGPIADNIQPLPRSSGPDIPPSTVRPVDNRNSEPTSMPSVSKSSIAVSESSTISDANKTQHQKNGLLHSRSSSVTIPLNSVHPASPSINHPKQPTLPKEYLNRKTENSAYRTLAINAWKKSDVLDFLFDLELYPMMPICESMSGKGLTRFFRMCQTKPSRLYGQLNEELRVRFNNLTLPMGVYTQFLIEMDSLIGPAPESLPPIAPKMVERVIYTPVTYGQQSQRVQQSPRLSTHPANSHNGSNSTEMISQTNTGHHTRIVERAIFRPGTISGRPYNFIVESVEEPTELLRQVERYGSEFIPLDNTATQYYQTNNALKN